MPQHQHHPHQQSQNMFGIGNNNNSSSSSPSPIVPLMHATPFHHLGRSNSNNNSNIRLMLPVIQDEGPPGVNIHHNNSTVTPLGDIIGEAPMELDEELQSIYLLNLLI
jgi:hypothetical protein